MAKFKFELGVEARSKITGFTGILTARAEHLTGCNRYYMQPVCQEGKNYEEPSGSWMDEGELEKLKARKVVTKKSVKAPKNGACAPDPTL